jgi:hypothetical protein
MTILPFDRDRILKWMRNTSTDKLEAQLDSAIRAGSTERAALLQETLARRRQRQEMQKLARMPRHLRPRPTPRLCGPWRPIVDEVCLRHRVSLGELTGGRRVLQVRRARHELWFLLHSQRGVSFAEIGRRLGGFDHTSVSYGVRKWAEEVA